MEQVASVTPEVTFDFDFYRFTGKGGRPTLVSLRSRSILCLSRDGWYLIDSKVAGRKPETDCPRKSYCGNCGP